jgi:Amt family ammonium transporter
MKSIKHFLTVITVLLTSALWAWAEDPAPTVLSNKEAIDLVQTHANYLWTLVAAALVFFMQAGFAMVEAGFHASKNAVNIIMKNLMDFSMGSIAFWAIGFGLMFGASQTGWFGTSGFFSERFYPGRRSLGAGLLDVPGRLLPPRPPPSFPAPWPNGPNSGYLAYSAVSQRHDLSDFRQLGLGQPVQRQRLAGRTGFHRFRRLHRGSLRGRLGRSGRCHRPGPRLGKYGKDGSVRPIMGHNIPWGPWASLSSGWDGSDSIPAPPPPPTKASP